MFALHQALKVFRLDMHPLAHGSPTVCQPFIVLHSEQKHPITSVSTIEGLRHAELTVHSRRPAGQPVYLHALAEQTRRRSGAGSESGVSEHGSADHHICQIVQQVMVLGCRRILTGKVVSTSNGSELIVINHVE